MWSLVFQLQIAFCSQCLNSLNAKIGCQSKKNLASSCERNSAPMSMLRSENRNKAREDFEERAK